VQQKALMFVKTHLTVSQLGLNKIVERENESLIKQLALVELSLAIKLLEEVEELLLKI
jgi:hypothetical protein